MRHQTKTHPMHFLWLFKITLILKFSLQIKHYIFDRRQLPDALRTNLQAQ